MGSSTTHHRHSVARPSRFWLFEMFACLQVIGCSITSIFIPSLLLTKGYPLQAVLWYLVLLYAIDVPLNFLSAALIRKIGAKKAMIFATFAEVAFLMAFFFASGQGWGWLVVMACLSAVYDTLYWIGHLCIFVQSEEQGSSVDGDVGIFYAIRQVASLLGPMIGALFILFHNPAALVGASVLFLALSLLPLLRLRLPRLHQEPILSPRRFYADPERRTSNLYMVLYCLHDTAEMILWPLFIFVAFGSLNAVALLAIIVAWSAVIFSYIVGRVAIRHHMAMISFGSLLIAAVWIVRIAAHGPALYYPSLIVMSFLSLAVLIPVDGGIVAVARGRHALSVMTYRNAAGMAAPLILFLTLAILTSVFKVAFGIAAVSMICLAGLATSFLFRSRKVPAAGGRPDGQSFGDMGI